MTRSIKASTDRPRPVGARIQHMRLSIEATPSVVTISVSGDVDAAEASALVVAVNRALCDGARSVVIDCARVDFIDSVGLNALIEGHRRATTRGIRYTIGRPSLHVARMLRLAGLDEVLAVEPVMQGWEHAPSQGRRAT